MASLVDGVTKALCSDMLVHISVVHMLFFTFFCSYAVVHAFVGVPDIPFDLDDEGISGLMHEVESITICTGPEEGSSQHVMSHSTSPEFPCIAAGSCNPQHHNYGWPAVPPPPPSPPHPPPPASALRV